MPIQTCCLREASGRSGGPTAINSSRADGASMKERTSTEFIAVRHCKHCGNAYPRKGFGKGNKGHCSLSCRFWSKVDRRGENECWPWTAARNVRSGYGTFGQQKAHRVSYFIAHGVQPGQVVMHTCDNPPCVNPAHLVSSTQIENIADRHSKGRSGSASGSRHGNSKLTEDQVLQIKRDKRSGAEIARMLGLSKSTTCRIKAGSVWRHVDVSQ